MGPPKFDKKNDGKAADKVMLASLRPGDDTGALGYAPADGGTAGRASSMFERVLKDQPEAFIPPVDGDDHAWAATPLPKEAYSESEQTCLANGIYFEARGESEEGQAAVAQVILNRVRNPAYPNSICGVVYQNKNWRNRCQFSFACDGHKDRIRDAGAYAKAEEIAKEATTGEVWIAEVGSATHYHANYVRPRWARAMEKVDKIGRHIFYRTFNGGR
ncbi:cell wall hydrolase [Jiella endophytica]|uniref:Cell wall hydrolase n=2 Tax=Jiella endophytica TaxID=2558362 RepID=A0A4Y8RVX6_9HYPH|nr:cell wall hydrolase [Jiella endophytica]